jgi:hypothetical protein
MIPVAQRIILRSVVTIFLVAAVRAHAAPLSQATSPWVDDSSAPAAAGAVSGPLHLRDYDLGVAYDPPAGPWETSAPIHLQGGRQTIWRWRRARDVEIAVSVLTASDSGTGTVGLALRPAARGDTYQHWADLAGRSGEHESGQAADGRALDLFSATDKGALYQVGVVAKKRDDAFLAAAAAGLRIATRILWTPEPLECLPADTFSVVGAPRAEAPLVHLLVQYAGYAKQKVPCIAEEAALVTSSYQVWNALEDHEPVGLAQGSLDRKPLESCIETALRSLGTSPRLSRSGAITEVDDPLFDRVFLGWTPSWIVWDADRTRVQRMMSALHAKKTSISPFLGDALAHVDRSHLWGVSLADLTSRSLGMPSAWVAVETTAGGHAGAMLDVAFELGSHPRAEQAAMAAKRAFDQLPANLRAPARTAEIRVDDDLVRLILDADVWLKPEAMATVQSLVRKKNAASDEPVR